MRSGEQIGWLMFLLSGLLFFISGIRARDWLTICGSILWLVGCSAFLLQGFREQRPETDAVTTTV